MPVYVTGERGAKEHIKRCLSQFKTYFTVNDLNAPALMTEVLNENPVFMAYIKEYSCSGMFLGVAFKVVYGNTDVAPDDAFGVESAAEADAVLHFAIGRHIEKIILYSKKRINFQNVYNDFMISYGGYYSNLLSIEGNGYSAATGECFLFSFEYRIGKVKLNIMRREVDKRTEIIANQIFTSDMSPAVKAYIAHNYLALNVSYRNSDKADPLERSYLQSAYGALINGECVCQGYAEAYKRILDSQNIKCEVLCGKIKGSEEHHAWNAVSIDGREYFHVDVTWDSNRGTKSDTYYGKNDAYMKSSRIWTRRSDVICNGATDYLRIAKSELALKMSEYVSKGIDKKYMV